jgi:cell filamentation protein
MRRPDPYLYEDVPVLKNLLGIRSKTELKLVERNHCQIMLKSVYSTEYEIFNLETLCDIHRTIFSSLYEWAGQLRRIPIRKPEKVLNGKTVRYTEPSEIVIQLDQIFDEIARIQTEKCRKDILTDIVRITAKLWKIHPFREGNTRSIIAFSVLLAAKLGIKLDPGLFAVRAAEVRSALALCSQENRSAFEDLTQIYLDAAARNNLNKF